MLWPLGLCTVTFGFQNPKKNSFRGNYMRKYGSSNSSSITFWSKAITYDDHPFLKRDAWVNAVFFPRKVPIPTGRQKGISKGVVHLVTIWKTLMKSKCHHGWWTINIATLQCSCYGFAMVQLWIKRPLIFCTDQYSYPNSL